MYLRQLLDIKIFAKEHVVLEAGTVGGAGGVGLGLTGLLVTGAGGHSLHFRIPRG